MIDNYWNVLLHYSLLFFVELTVLSCIVIVFMKTEQRNASNKHDGAQRIFPLSTQIVLGVSIFCLSVFVVSASSQFFVLAVQTISISVIIFLMFAGVFMVGIVFWLFLKEDHYKSTTENTLKNNQERSLTNVEFDMNEQELAYLEHDIY